MNVNTRTWYNGGFLDNEYTQELIDILQEFNDFNKVVESSQNELVLVESDNRRINNTNITEEDIQNGITQEMLNEEINNSNRRLESELFEKRQIHEGKLYHLTDIKEETTKKLNAYLKRILIEEKRIGIAIDSLDLNSMEENITPEEYRKSMDEALLKRQKLQETRNQINSLINSMELTKEETELLMRGLNEIGRKEYDRLKGTAPIVENDLDATNDQTPTETFDPSLGEPEFTPSEDFETTNETIDPIEPEPIEPIVGEPNEPIVGEPDTEEPENEYKEAISLDGLIHKVLGENVFDDKEVSKYMASKIKVFKLPPKNNLGNSYKLVSVAKTLLGFVASPIRKLYGKLLKNDKVDIFKEIEARAMQLTDREVEIYLENYKGTTALSRKASRMFMEAMEPRIMQYTEVRLGVYNQALANLYQNMEIFIELIDKLKEELEVAAPEEKAVIQEKIDQAYENAKQTVAAIVKTKREANSLTSGTSALTHDQTKKAMLSKINYQGGRFSAKIENNPELNAQLAVLSDIIEPNDMSLFENTPAEEIVDAYLKRLDIYDKNTSTKRSFKNLGSEVSSGALQREDYVRKLDYRDDPFMKDLMMSIMVVATTINITDAIITNLRNARAEDFIREYNNQIAQHNSDLQAQQQYIDSVRSTDMQSGIEAQIRSNTSAGHTTSEVGTLDQTGWSFNSRYYDLDKLTHTTYTELQQQALSDMSRISEQVASGSISKSEGIRQMMEIQNETSRALGEVHQQFNGAFNAQNDAGIFDYNAVVGYSQNAATYTSDIIASNSAFAEIVAKSLELPNVAALPEISTAIDMMGYYPSIIMAGTLLAGVDTRRGSVPVESDVKEKISEKAKALRDKAKEALEKTKKIIEEKKAKEKIKDSTEEEIPVVDSEPEMSTLKTTDEENKHIVENPESLSEPEKKNTVDTVSDSMDEGNSQDEKPEKREWAELRSKLVDLYEKGLEQEEKAKGVSM